MSNPPHAWSSVRPHRAQGGPLLRHHRLHGRFLLPVVLLVAVRGAFGPSPPDSSGGPPAEARRRCRCPGRPRLKTPGRCHVAERPVKARRRRRGPRRGRRGPAARGRPGGEPKAILSGAPCPRPAQPGAERLPAAAPSSSATVHLQVNGPHHPALPPAAVQRGVVWCEGPRPPARRRQRLLAPPRPPPRRSA